MSLVFTPSHLAESSHCIFPMSLVSWEKGNWYGLHCWNWLAASVEQRPAGWARVSYGVLV